MSSNAEHKKPADSWLNRYIRPLTLVFLLLFTAVLIWMDSEFDKGFEVKDSYISMLELLNALAIGWYFGSRGIKKMDQRRLDAGHDPLSMNPFKRSSNDK